MVFDTAHLGLDYVAYTTAAVDFRRSVWGRQSYTSPMDRRVFQLFDRSILVTHEGVQGQISEINHQEAMDFSNMKGYNNTDSADTQLHGQCIEKM